jgi:DNA invertase Pin-like site-specific DNA recombinase
MEQLRIARIYLRVSTNAQDLERQEKIIKVAKDNGYYVAGVYREKASGARADRPELLRLVADLQPGEVVVAEKIDRISRLPLPEAERLIKSIRDKGARLSVPDVVDLSDLSEGLDGIGKIVVESVQEMLLRLALQIAHDDYEDRQRRQREGIALRKLNKGYQGRKPNTELHKHIIKLRENHYSISEIATMLGCSETTVKNVLRKAGKTKQGKRRQADQANDGR